MTTYRTGNHWGVTIVREGEHGGDCFDTCNGHPGAQLVAVVVNGDQALAERICALLNGEPCRDRVTGLHLDPCSCPSSAPLSASDASGVPESGSDGSGGPEGLMGRYASYRCAIPGHQGCDPYNCRWAPEEPRCICDDPPPTVDKPKSGIASRPDGWACPRHGVVI